MILLNPGPVNLSERVRGALLGPDLCHREPEFAALQSRIRERLLEVYALAPDTWAAVLLTGSGTAAVEAMVSSLVPRTGRLAVVENGVYGERLARIAEVHGIPCTRVSHPWTAPIDAGAVAGELDARPGITHLAVVHHETTSGRLNDLAPLGGLCRARGIALLVDAVSSFGAEALAFEDWGIAACAATANKCLHGVPGAAFVIARRAALAHPEQAPRSLYLDLPAYCAAQDRGDTPFTQSVQSFYALDEALAEFHEEGGRTARHGRYRELAELVRAGLAEAGVAPLIAPAESSVVLRAYELPPGLDYAHLHDALKQRGFVIYAGQGALARRIFRIATMGEVTPADMRRLVAAMAEILGD